MKKILFITVFLFITISEWGQSSKSQGYQLMAKKDIAITASGTKCVFIPHDPASGL